MPQKIVGAGDRGWGLACAPPRSVCERLPQGIRPSFDMNEDILELAPNAEEAFVADVPAKKEAIQQSRRVGRRAIFYPLIFVLIIAFFVLNQIYKERAVSKSSPAQVTQPASVSVRAPQSEQGAALPEFPDVKKLMITCHERTWVSVVIDGNEKRNSCLIPKISSFSTLGKFRSAHR